LTIAFLLSAYVNAIAKILADQPRPFEVDSRVRKLYDPTGGGFPSGVISVRSSNAPGCGSSPGC